MHGGVPTAPGISQVQAIVCHPGTETQEGKAREGPLVEWVAILGANAEVCAMVM
jgi:hypothetical protein